MGEQQDEWTKQAINKMIDDVSTLLPSVTIAPLSTLVSSMPSQPEPLTPKPTCTEWFNLADSTDSDTDLFVALEQHRWEQHSSPPNNVPRFPAESCMDEPPLPEYHNEVQSPHVECKSAAVQRDPSNEPTFLVNTWEDVNQLFAMHASGHISLETLNV